MFHQAELANAIGAMLESALKKRGSMIYRQGYTAKKEGPCRSLSTRVNFDDGRSSHWKSFLTKSCGVALK